MATLYDLGQLILKIRTALNEIEVRGEKNASYICYAIKTCNECVQMINDTTQASMRKEEVNDHGE